MLENVLTLRQVPAKKKIAVKTAVSAFLVALAVALPQLVHLALGAPGGVRWLPMYLPVLIGGCLLGTKWALFVGVCSPLASFVITSAIGQPMPAAGRLPFMIVELAVFAFVAGLFSKRIFDNALWAFPAVFTAQVFGRAAFLGLIALFGSFAGFSTEMIFAQIKTGLVGLFVQLVAAPAIIIVLAKLLKKDNA